MKKKTAILIFMIQMTVLGVAQTPKDSCSIPKDSLCQERIAKSDTINCPLDKLFLLKANVTNKEESKRNLPKIALPKNDIYREKDSEGQFAIYLYQIVFFTFRFYFISDRYR